MQFTGARRVMNPLALAILTALVPVGVTVAQQAPVVPDSGTFLQQLKPNRPPAPSPSATGLTIEQPNGQKLPASEVFMVTRLEIKGSAHFDAQTLHALIADAEGKQLNLTQLGAVADRITEHYHKNHYPLARALIPAQTIKDGVVVIQVLEAKYGKVSLQNREPCHRLAAAINPCAPEGRRCDRAKRDGPRAVVALRCAKDRSACPDQTGRDGRDIRS